MIEEAYVSFETANLLKEKGFNENTMYSYYMNNGSVFYKISESKSLESSTSCNSFPRPTQQMAMRWLREVHNIHIYIQAFLTTEGLEGYVAYYTSDEEFMWRALPMEDSYEEATDAAIKYCLENLI